MLEDFQNKEEVKEYLENLGIEYRFQCYSEKRPDGCHRLGDFLEAVKQDFTKAAVVYQQNCDTTKYPKSCFKIGNYRMIGRGCKSDGEIAMKYHKLACDGGHPVGCYQAGVLRLTGEYGARQNSEEARELLKSGCDKDDSESCYFLSTLYLKPQLTGQPPISPDAQQNAFEFTKRACELNHIYACANLYQLYMKGMGCDQSEELATEAKRKAVAIRDLYERREPGVVFGEG